MIDLDDLTGLPGARLLQPGPASFSGVTTDSRQVPDGSLFIALVAERDGHEYAAAAATAGAGGLLVERPVEAPTGVAVVQVPDTLAALQALGSAARERLTGRVVSVTGSVGKTTTKALIQHVLAATTGDVAANEKSYNNHLGVPLTLLRIAQESPDAATVVTEVGTNNPGEIGHLAGLIRPQVSVVTGVGFAHVGNFTDRDALADEKVSLYAHTDGVWVVNADDALVASALERIGPPARARVVRVGFAADADLRAGDVVVDERGTSGVLTERGATEGVKFRIPLVGRHFAYTVLFAVAVAREAGVSLADAVAAVEGFPAAEGRASISRVGDLTLIDDSYNGSPDATLAALDTLATMPEAQRVAVLGEMRELGDWSERLHEEVAAKVAQVATHFVAVGANAEEVRRAAVASGLPEERAWAADNAMQAGTILAEQVRGPAAVLVKGSRFSHMERVVLMLAGEEVGCRLGACTLYIHCRNCPDLRTGPPSSGPTAAQEAR